MLNTGPSDSMQGVLIRSLVGAANIGLRKNSQKLVRGATRFDFTRRQITSAYTAAHFGRFRIQSLDLLFSSVMSSMSGDVSNEENPTVSRTVEGEISTLPSTMEGESSTVPSTMEGESSTLPSTMEGESSTLPSTMEGESSTLPSTMEGESSTVPSTIEGESSTSLSTLPSNMEEDETLSTSHDEEVRDKSDQESMLVSDELKTQTSETPPKDYIPHGKFTTEIHKIELRNVPKVGYAVSHCLPSRPATTSSALHH